MDVKKKYAKVAKEYHEKNYETALKLLHKMKANEKDYYFLEAANFYELKNFVKAYHALKKLLPMLPVFTPEDKKVYEECVANLASCCSNLGLIEESLNLLNQLLKTTDEYRFYSVILALCFDMNAKEDCTAADFQAVYDTYRDSFKFEPFPRRFYEHDKIRVGFLSADFRAHVVIKIASRLLTDLDKKSFQVYCYSNFGKPDEVSKKLQARVYGWREIYELTDEQAAELIRDDEIDILFDLSGHTGGNRLGVMAYRPASVQISGIGFICSTGLKTVDYFLTDVHCIGNSAPYFTEDFIALPHSHICLSGLDYTEIEPATEPPCFKNGYVTFGCFNKYMKITDSMLITWKKILDAVPDSRLILDHPDYVNNDSKIFVSNRLKQFGFDLKRVELRCNLRKYPLDYDDIDIALDTFPYTGVTTTYEAFVMGVPVISLYGDRHASRCGLSLLKNIGLDELAVDSYEDYVKRAVMLANDWELLALLKKNLRTMLEQSPLMDFAGYIHDMEQAFIEVLNAARSMFVASKS